MTTLYTARYLYRPDYPLIEDAALLVSEGRVVDAGRRADVLSGFAEIETIETIDLGDSTILPTFVNAHTHLELTDFPLWAAEVDRKSDRFVDWILQLIGIKRTLDQGQYVTSVKHGIIESFNAGVGSVGDVISCFDARSVYREFPMSGRLFPEMIGHNKKLGTARLLQVIKILEEGSCGAMQMGVSPHSPYTISAKFLKQLLDIASDYKIPAMMHLAESAEEIEFISQSSGPIVDELYQLAGWDEYLPEPWQDGPLSWFLHHGNPQMIAVHGVRFTAQEIEVLGERGGNVVLCPRSNQALGVGLPDIPAMMRAGVNLSLGTDSRASVESLSIWDEMAFIGSAYGGVIDPVAMFYMATKGGSEMLSLPFGTATLAEGSTASFQVVDTPVGLSEDELLESLVATGPQERLRAVYIEGNIWDSSVYSRIE